MSQILSHTFIGIPATAANLQRVQREESLKKRNYKIEFMNGSTIFIKRDSIYDLDLDMGGKLHGG